MNIFNFFKEKKKKKKELLDVLHYLDTIPNINCGGCGYSALTIHKWLEQKGKKSKIAFVYTNPYEFETNENNKMNNMTLGVPNHAVVRYKRRFIDSHGKYDMNIYNRRYIIATEEDLRETLKLIPDWNPKFNRNYVNNIEKKFNISLNYN